jgi:hypothetical protein
MHRQPITLLILAAQRRLFLANSEFAVISIHAFKAATRARRRLRAWENADLVSPWLSFTEPSARDDQAAAEVLPAANRDGKTGTKSFCYAAHQGRLLPKSGRTYRNILKVFFE